MLSTPPIRLTGYYLSGNIRLHPSDSPGVLGNGCQGILSEVMAWFQQLRFQQPRWKSACFAAIIHDPARFAHPIRAIHGMLSNHGNAIPSVWVDVYDNAQLCLDNSLTPGRVTNARQESDLRRSVHAVAAEIRPTTMAPSKMKSEVARSGLVIIK